VQHAPPGALKLAAVYLSSGSALVPVPPFGILRIDPHRAASWPPVTIPAHGLALVTAIPSSASLLCQSIFSQAMLVVFLNGLRLRNVVADVIQ
jgi:hypothetical protein